MSDKPHTLEDTIAEMRAFREENEPYYRVLVDQDENLCVVQM